MGEREKGVGRTEVRTQRATNETATRAALEREEQLTASPSVDTAEISHDFVMSAPCEQRKLLTINFFMVSFWETLVKEKIVLTPKNRIFNRDTVIAAVKTMSFSRQENVEGCKDGELLKLP